MVSARPFEVSSSGLVHRVLTLKYTGGLVLLLYVYSRPMRPRDFPKDFRDFRGHVDARRDPLGMRARTRMRHRSCVSTLYCKVRLSRELCSRHVYTVTFARISVIYKHALHRRALVIFISLSEEVMFRFCQLLSYFTFLAPLSSEIKVTMKDIFRIFLSSPIYISNLHRIFFYSIYTIFLYEFTDSIQRNSLFVTLLQKFDIKRFS